MKPVNELTQEELEDCFRLAFNEPIVECGKRITGDGIEVYSYHEITGNQYVLTLWFNGDLTGENRGFDGKHSKPVVIRTKAVADYINSL